LKEIVVVGLGPGSFGQLSLESWQVLNIGKNIYFRTGRHPVIKELANKGIVYNTFDYLYDKKESFAEVYESIADELICKVKDQKQVIYGVPGHPFVGEITVPLLIKKAKEQGISVKVIASMSFIDSMLSLLQIDPVDGFSVVDALDCNNKIISVDQHIIFTQVYNRMIASELKLYLLDIYPFDHIVYVVRAAGIPDEEKQEKVILSELDHLEWFDHLTSVYVTPLKDTERLEMIKAKKKAKYFLDPLINVIDKLLSPEGCPWDREQDHFSLKHCLIEEAYEVIEAIDCKDMDKLREELGDLLLQVIFHTALAQRRGDFDYNDVVEEITEKMVRRHPHVFGNVSVSNSSEVIKNWEQIKKEEKGNDTKGKRIMETINRSLPALLMAEEVQKKARKVGFDWDDIKGPLEKVKEELKELEEAIFLKNENKGKQVEIEDELGDLLFATVNVARFVCVSPEIALYSAVRKFTRRFNYIEENITSKNMDWKEADGKLLNNLWKEAKLKGI